MSPQQLEALAQPDFTWVSAVDRLTFLRIYDVFTDLVQQVNLARLNATCVVVPMYDSHLKFPELCPSTQQDVVTRYAFNRRQAVEFLSDRKVVGAVFPSAGNWWEIQITVFFDRSRVMQTAAVLAQEFNRRFSLPPATRATNPVASVKNLLHPEILSVAWQRYENQHYADAAEAAMKHVNSRVKEIVRRSSGRELDGKALMEQAFSPNSPVITLDDLSTESGRNIQQGYMLMSAGAMLGVRNPKAHENISIDERRCIHFLFLASLLLCKVDERILPRANPPALHVTGS